MRNPNLKTWKLPKPKTFSLPYHTSRLLELSDVSIAYGSRAVCSNISFTIEQGDRIVPAGEKKRFRKI